MIKRYRVWSDYAGEHHAADDAGEWCKASDVKILEDENDSLNEVNDEIYGRVQRMEAENERLRDACEVALVALLKIRNADLFEKDPLETTTNGRIAHDAVVKVDDIAGTLMKGGSDG